MKDAEGREARDLAELAAMAKMFCKKTDFIRFITTSFEGWELTSDQLGRLTDVDAAAVDLVEQGKHGLQVRDAIATFEQNRTPQKMTLFGS